MSHVAVKEAVFPFARFPGVDVILGPEMKSTGGGDGSRSGLRAGLREGPARGRRGAPGERSRVHLRAGPRQAERGRARPTPRRARLLPGRDARDGAGPCTRRALAAETVNKVLEGPPHIVDALKDDRIDFMINTTESARSITDSSRDAPDGAPEETCHTPPPSRGRARWSTQSPPSARPASTSRPSSPTATGRTTVS